MSLVLTKGPTRRWLLASVSAGVIAAAIPAIPEADARPRFQRGGQDSTITSGSSAAPGTYTLTYVNTAGSTSPADLPLAAKQWFVPGDVPTGKIAVPQVGGVDLVYQADQRTYWGDGSLKGAMFCIARSGALTAGASVQISWDIRTGSYDNTSAITTANITGSSDYKIAITNCHTAQPGAAESVGVKKQAVASLTIGAGQVTGAKVWFPSNLTVGTVAVPITILVSNGGGAGATLQVVNGVATILNPGSGYVNVGSGSFTVAFNDVITAINSGGNHANGVSIEQYRKGAVCDGWRARTTVSGLNHYHVTFYIERWKKADGSFLAFRACAVYGTGLVDTVNSIPNYTYDLDWKNGSTVIRGVSNGDTVFQTMLHFMGSSGATFGTDSRMDWSTNHAAWNAVQHTRTAAECDQFRKTGIILPYLNLTPTTVVPTTPAYYEQNQAGGINFYGLYQPFGVAGVRAPLGAGGAGPQENPMNTVDGLYWMSLRTGRAGAATWLNNLRVAAAHSLGSSQLGSQFFEPTTLYIPNVVPASSQAFAGMTPTRESIYIGTVKTSGYVNTMFEATGAFDVNGGPSIPYHQVCCTYGAYIIDGEQWQMDALTHSGTNPLWSFAYSFARTATLGSTLYPALMCNKINNVRVPTWYLRSIGFAASCMPAAWADGTTNIERSYVYYATKCQLDYWNDLVPFIGNVKFGAAAAIPKTIDYTGTGWWPENFTSARGPDGSELTVPFMDSYNPMVTAMLAYLHQGTTLGTAASTWTKYFKNYNVKLWASPGSHFLCDGYRIRNLEDRPPAPVVDPQWATWSATTPKLAIWPQGLTLNQGVTISTTAGSSTVGLTAGGVRFTPGVAMANGSRIRLTLTDINKAGGFSVGGVPDGFDDGIWYYWLQGGTPASGQLCTALDGGGSPDPATAVVSLETLGAVAFWFMPANPLPADSAGFGTYTVGASATPSSRIAQELGRLRLMKAYGFGPDANGDTDAAIANANAIFSSVGGSYASLPQYAWDSTL